ncbi:MAG: phospho-N-acetylmuramoyl-pentapeptide-transferase [Anaerovoracaceae bacterium]
MNYVVIIMTCIFGLLLGAVLTSSFIPILRSKQMGQNIRTEGPESHQKKAGTPSMGGVAIILATVLAVATTHYFDENTKIIALGFLGFGVVGFIDDYLKVIKKQNEGLKPWQKLGMQLVISIAVAVYFGYFSTLGTEVYIPFVKTYIDFGVLYVPFVIFTMLAMTNGVNLTDGLDGLAAGVTIIVALFMAVQAGLVGGTATSAFLGGLAGACIGFLMFNKNPAKIFMGDTGSLALGGGLAVAAFAVKLELLLPIVGIMYVLETVSVILQVGYFKISGGKRLFRMAPLHHHFEEGGMKETVVVAMFWLITLVCCFIAMVLA